MSSEGQFKDKNNGTRTFKVWSNYNKKMRAQFKPI